MTANAKDGANPMMFSVIVPIYKVEKHLRCCVDSILAQTYADFEVLLVDDGSPDGCPALCDEYAKKDPRVKVIHKPNGGLISARNAGILAAKGDYICYVDGDDWTKENMLQFVHDKIEESPVPLDMVLFAADNVFEDHLEETINDAPEGYYDRKRMEEELFPHLLVDTRNGIRAGSKVQAHTWDKAVKRELQVKYYTRDERIRVFTDVPMTYECLLNCQNIYLCNEKLYLYNKTNECSIRALSKENLLTQSFYYLTVYMQEHLRGYAPTIDRQLNEFPAMLITRTCKWQLENSASVREAAQKIKAQLNETGILSLVTPQGLPTGPRLLISLLKAGLYTPALLLCKTRFSQKRRQNSEG